MQRIVYFGDSLTAGYGLNPAQSFPALLQEKIFAEQLAYDYVNAGVSGDTTSSALLRLPNLLQSHFDIFVLALGANDMLRFYPATTIHDNLATIIDQVRAKQPDSKILLLGMEIPSWLQLEKAAPYRNIYHQLADRYQLPLVPFLLEGVLGQPQLNLPDRVHPNAAGYQRIAARVWPSLRELL